MGNKAPWKIGMTINLPVTSRPLISLQKEAVPSPCNFATTHLTACILTFLCPLNFATHETEDPFATPQNSSQQIIYVIFSAGFREEQAFREKLKGNN